MRPAHVASPPGEHRDPAPRSTPFSYCWDYNAGEDGSVQDRCTSCVVYQTRAQRCYEVARLAPEVGHTMTFCRETCDDCDYYRHVQEQGTNVLLVSDDPVLTSALAAASQDAPFRLEIADCEYTASALVDSFRPDFAIVDCSLGDSRSRDIRRHLSDDPRIPLIRLILAASPDAFPDVCDEELFALLSKPFTTDDVVACLGSIPGLHGDGRPDSVWTTGERRTSAPEPEPNNRRGESPSRPKREEDGPGPS